MQQEAQVTLKQHPAWLSPLIAVFAVLAIAVSLVHLPGVSQASAGDVILFWEDALIPSGWSCISCDSDLDPFFGVFPRASSTYGSITSGANTVTHTLTFSTSTTGAAVGQNSATAGTAAPASTHLHTWGAPTLNSGDVKPSFKNLKFIKANAPTSLPNGAIAMFEVASTSSLPANWSYYDALDGVFLRGENATSTGGAGTHNHTTAAALWAASSSGALADPGNGLTTASGVHSHSIASGSSLSTAAVNDPSFVTVVFAKLSATSSLPSGLVALFDNTSLPANWTIVSTSGSPYAERFFKGQNQFGTTGGNAAHDHDGSTTYTSGGPSATLNNKSGAAANTNTNTHTHTVTYTISSESSLPLYRNVIVGKYSQPLPGTPGTPTYTSIATSTYTVSWASATDADYYRLERATSSEAYAEIATTTALSYSESGRSPNTAYFYKVRATNGAGNSPYSATSSVKTLPDAPGTPSFSSVTTSTLTVSWTAPSGGSDFYRLERATSSEAYAEIATTTALSYGDSGRTPNTSYFYRVRGANSTGNGSYSASSSQLMFPDKPGVPTYSNVSTSTLDVSWTASNGGAQYYRLERSSDGNSFLEIATTTALTYGDSGRSPNTTYWYRARATNATGNSTYSASSSVLTVPGEPGTPTYPTVGTTTVTVEWAGSSGGASFYRLERGTNGNGPFSEIATTTATTYNDSGLTTSTTYWYRARGNNSTGNGPYSATSSVTTGSGANVPPEAPTLDSPLNGSQNVPALPVFKMTATDSNGDYLRYKVTIYSNSGCTTVVQTNDQNVSQTGWSGQNASSGTAYTSGTQGVFTTQSSLATGTTYWWKASAKDPDGSNTFTDSAACNSFTTTAGLWTTDSGSWSVSANQLTVSPAAGASVQIRVTGQSQTNGAVDVKAKSSAVGASTGNAGPVVRADTGSNRYQLGNLDVASALHRIGEVIAGAYGNIVTAAFSAAADTFYQLRGYISGSSLQSWINGGTALSATDTSLSAAGNLGLMANATSGGSVTFTFDNFAFYSSTTITLNNLPSGGSWSVLTSTSSVISCRTASTWDLATYGGQVPIDYDLGGGKVSVWVNSTCSGGAGASYPTSSLASDIFGGDVYSYNSGEGGDEVTASSTITVSASGLISF